MGPHTYKVFNIYSFIRCGTYNSHLHTTTLPLKCESITLSCSPPEWKLFTCLYRCCWTRATCCMYCRCCFLRK